MTLFRYGVEPATWTLVDGDGEEFPQFIVMRLQGGDLAVALRRGLDIDADSEEMRGLMDAILAEKDDFQIVFGDTQKATPEIKRALLDLGIDAGGAVAWRARPPVWHLITRAE
jgi:hypothetical protein